MFWISCHVVAPMQPSAGEVQPRNLPPYSVVGKKTRVPGFDPRRQVSVGQNVKTLPAHPNGSRPHRTQHAAANRAHLRKETTTSTCPTKNGRAERHAYGCLPPHLRRSAISAGSFGAEAMTPAQLTPNPLPDEDDAETPQAPPASDAEDAPTPKKEDAAPAKAIRRAKRA